MEKAALRKIREDASDAVAILNPLFGMSLQAPRSACCPGASRTPTGTREDGRYYAPPQVQHLPDVTYHEVSHVYLDRTWPESLESTRLQVFAILESAADILANVVKQRRLGQTAAEGDWVVAPGAVAWIRGEDPATGADRSPLRSLKEPGSAYRDDTFGGDRQLRSFDQIEEGKLLDPFRLAGIPSKAFYELAIRIGTDKPIGIWLDAIRGLSADADQDLRSLASLSSQAAARRFGEESAERAAVEAAWEVVRVPRREPEAAEVPGGS